MNNITITDRDDGFGAQYQHIIYGILYAEMNNKIYIHKPITNMAHNYDNNPNFINEIEEFINIRNHYKTTNEISNVEIVDFWTLYNFITADDKSYPNIDKFNHCLNSTNALEKIKTIFWENKTNPYLEEGETINVAVHIRRPNNQDDRIEGADTPDEYYLNLMDKIRKEHAITNQRKIQFHVYSQNTLDKKKYEQNDKDNDKDKDKDKNKNNNDIILHIDEDIKSTFTSLVAADILIASKSALSYCAGLLTNGKVYFIPFEMSSLNPPKNDWILTNDHFNNSTIQ